MKIFRITKSWFLLVLLFSPTRSFANADSLVVTLKSGHRSSIAIPAIQKITFENATNTVKGASNESSNLSIIGTFPNPAQDKISIAFKLVSAGDVTISIFDELGELIQTLNATNCSTGSNRIEWNFMNTRGERVVSGVYFYRIRYGNEVVSDQIVLTK